MAGCIIGLTDQYNERGSDRTGWEWFDESTYNFSNWAPGEPNQWGGNQENCVQIWMQFSNYPAGVWNDVKYNEQTQNQMFLFIQSGRKKKKT